MQHNRFQSPVVSVSPRPQVPASAQPAPSAARRRRTGSSRRSPSAAQADRGERNAGEVGGEGGVVDNAGARALEGPERVVLQRRVEDPGRRQRLRLRRHPRIGGREQEVEEAGADQEAHSKWGRASELSRRRRACPGKSGQDDSVMSGKWQLGLGSAEMLLGETRTGFGAEEAGILCRDGHLRPRTGPRNQAA